MGYYIFSFCIDTHKIKSAFGSKDQALLKAAKDTESYENYSDADTSFNEGISTGKALEDIINGNRMDVNSGHAYGYALICMCATGERLPYSEEIKLGTQTDLINKYLEEDFELNDIDVAEMLFLDDSNPFEIPFITDFPMIGLLNDAALKVAKKIFENVTISEEDIDNLDNSEEHKDGQKAMIYENIRGIIQNIDYCIAHELDLISFCH